VKRNYVKGLLAGVLSTALVFGSIPVSNLGVTSVKAEEATSLPQPAYEYTFEAVSENLVQNTGTASISANGIDASDATMGGNNPTIVADEERGSNVLSLPGGSVGAGYLTLPESLFSEVEDGFSISFWVKADTTTNTHYNRIFESSSTELGVYEKGLSNDWVDPEFTMVVGGTDTASTRYDVCVNTSDKTKARLELGKALGNGEWSYLTASVTEDSFNVYMDGKSITATDLASNLSSALTKFFAELDDFKYSALGRSVYTSDKDTKALYDDFRFYNQALTAEEALAIYVDEYGQVVEETDGYEDEASLLFDMNKQTTDVFHGSTGFLYGVSEVNVPSHDLVTGIGPKLLVQKAADGKQHPSGDAYRLTDYLTETGIESIQVYLQDYYLEWPYEYNGIDDYNAKVRQIVTKMTQDKSKKDKYSYVLFNEPDGIWYSNNGTKLTSFYNDWLTIYTTVKSIDPDAKVAGPNFSVYNKAAYEGFFKFCKQNDCLPEMITWHDLQKDKLSYFATEFSQIQTMVETYYADSDIEPMYFVNETANFEDVGAPGPLVNWLAIYDEKDVYASLPYWGLANSLNELAATANKPNGGWWVYRWYSQMQGKKVEMTRENTSLPASSNKGDSLYGLTSIDADNQTVYSLFGGHDGTQVVRLKNLKEQVSFADAKSAHVKIYQSKYTGHQGFAYETPVVFEGDVAFNNVGTLSLILEDCDLLDAYFAVVTPSDSEVTLKTTEYDRNWTKTYEAESGKLLGNATKVTRTGGGDLARSNRAEVNNILSESDGVQYTVTVPEDGVYEAQIYYSVAAPYVNAVTLEEDASGQNRAIGVVVQNKLVVDGEEATTQILDFKSTVKSGYYNYEAVTLNLTAGKHTIAVTHYGEDQTNVSSTIRKIASQDKLDLIYAGETEEKEIVTAVEFEEVASENYTFGNDKEGYLGGGYKEGSGDMEINVVVREDGLYDTSLIYEAAEAGEISLSKVEFDYGKDATATAEVGLKEVMLTSLGVTADEGTFKTQNAGKIYLTAGANTLVVNSSAKIALDKIQFLKDDASTDSTTLTVEAEAGAMAGDVTKLIELRASGNTVVDGIGGGDAGNTLTVKVNAKEDGNYKLSMTYANDEPAPIMKDSDGNNYVHPYNTDLVERYAQIKVNDAEAETVYFRNTLSWEVFENVVIDVALKAGENTIVFSNDNSYKFSEVVDDYAPRFDKFEITPAYEESDYVAVVDDYTIKQALSEVAAISADDYTVATYKTFKEAKDALEALEGTNASEEAITNAIKALEEAKGALVGFAELKVQIAEAEKVTEADYTRRSYKVLKAEIEAAKAALTAEDTDAETIKAVMESLAAAKAALVLKQAPVDNSKGTITCSSSYENTNAEYAWDGDASTHPDLMKGYGDSDWDSSASWTAIEFEEAFDLVKISYAPRSGYTDRLENGQFYVSMDGETWTWVHTITEPADGYNTAVLDEPVTCRFVRYDSPANCYLNISDIKLFVQSEDDPEEGGSDKPGSDTPATPNDPTTPSQPTTPSTPTTPSKPAAPVDKNTELKKYVGVKVTAGSLSYKVTQCTETVKTVTVTGVKSKKTKLKSITIPATIKYDGMTFNVTEISKNAFKKQTKATKLTIGKNVTKIGANAFLGCSKLKTITFKGKAVKSIGKNAFSKIKKNATFKVPKAKKAAYKKLLKKAKTKNYKVK